MVEALKAQVAELTRRLEQNSQNSSRPPTSDSPFVKPEPKSLRRRSGRKPGGQQGHPGSTLAQVADPDERLRSMSLARVSAVVRTWATVRRLGWSGGRCSTCPR
jgi:hypothetical protein